MRAATVSDMNRDITAESEGVEYETVPTQRNTGLAEVLRDLPLPARRSLQMTQKKHQAKRWVSQANSTGGYDASFDAHFRAVTVQLNPHLQEDPTATMVTDRTF
jgi:hypothetical protein